MSIDYNRYYQAIENGVPAEELMSVMKKIESYNEDILTLKVLTSRIIYRPAGAPLPDEFQWVYIDGKKSVTWQLWIGESFSINLAFNNTLVAVDSSGEIIKDLDVTLKPIKDLSEMMYAEYKGSVCTLEDLYKSVFKKKSFFKVEFSSYWPKKATYTKIS